MKPTSKPLIVLTSIETKDAFSAHCESLDLTMAQVLRAMVRDALAGNIEVKIKRQVATELSNIAVRTPVLLPEALLERFKDYCLRRFANPSLVLRYMMQSVLSGDVVIPMPQATGAVTVIKETRTRT
jgi:hypothetical protein